MRFDFESMKPMDHYELLRGTVLPRPITIVTTLSPDGAPNVAATAYSTSWVTIHLS
jgi:flavin reductase (DIM6/NTAB) family NADH-FMN oxidoreductase RutF